MCWRVLVEMANFAIRTVKTLRNHWKKSVFIFSLSCYGLKYANDRHEENLLRRVYCAEAVKHGEAKISLGDRPRRVTVFLNPAAKAGKARKLFEKTAAPILYLAGIEVNVVKTEYEGQVKKFINVLENGETDAVIVAGGDGTLLEAITGILRKEEKAFHSIPVGIIPLGTKNTFARLLYGHDKEAVRMMADAAMSVVKNVTTKVDVLKVDGGEGKTTFALCGMEIGAYRDAEERKSKYWYFGPLKSRWTYVRTALKDWPPSLDVTLTYLEATEENMLQREEEVAQRRTWWSYLPFLSRRRQAAVVEQRQEMLKRDEEERVREEVSTVELTIMSPSMLAQQKLPGVSVGIGPGEPAKGDFMSEGWQRLKGTAPRYGCDSNRQLLVKDVSVAVHVPEEQNLPMWYNIDGESFEAIPVTISLLQKKLNFFYPVFNPDASST